MGVVANFSDIYSPENGQFFNGAFRTDSSKVTIGGIDGVGLLLQQLSFQYTQMITRLYELGSPGVYFVAGRSQGQLTVSEIVGPSAISLNFIRQFADVCQTQRNNLTLSATMGCDKASATAFRHKIQGCVITTISVSVQAENVVINQQLQMQFAALDIEAGN